MGGGVSSRRFRTWTGTVPVELLPRVLLRGEEGLDELRDEKVGEREGKGRGPDEDHRVHRLAQTKQGRTVPLKNIHRHRPMIGFSPLPLNLGSLTDFSRCGSPRGTNVTAGVAGSRQ